MRHDEPPLVGVDGAYGDSDALVKLRVAASGTFRGRVAAVVGATNRSHGDAVATGDPFCRGWQTKKAKSICGPNIFGRETLSASVSAGLRGDAKWCRLADWQWHGKIEGREVGKI